MLRLRNESVPIEFAIDAEVRLDVSFLEFNLFMHKIRSILRYKLSALETVVCP